jgi:hypothetical protein
MCTSTRSPPGRTETSRGNSERSRTWELQKMQGYLLSHQVQIQRAASTIKSKDSRNSALPQCKLSSPPTHT